MHKENLRELKFSTWGSLSSWPSEVQSERTEGSIHKLEDQKSYFVGKESWELRNLVDWLVDMQTLHLWKSSKFSCTRTWITWSNTESWTSWPSEVFPNLWKMLTKMQVKFLLPRKIKWEGKRFKSKKCQLSQNCKGQKEPQRSFSSKAPDMGRDTSH